MNRTLVILFSTITLEPPSVIDVDIDELSAIMSLSDEQYQLWEDAGMPPVALFLAIERGGLVNCYA